VENSIKSIRSYKNGQAFGDTKFSRNRLFPAIIEFNRRVSFQRKTVVMVWKWVEGE